MYMADEHLDKGVSYYANHKQRFFANIKQQTRYQGVSDSTFLGCCCHLSS